MGVYKFHNDNPKSREGLIFRHIKEGCAVIELDEDFFRAGTSFRMGLNLIKLGGLLYLETLEKVKAEMLEKDEDAAIFLNTVPQYGLLRVDENRFR